MCPAHSPAPSTPRPASETTRPARADNGPHDRHSGVDLPRRRGHSDDRVRYLAAPGRDRLSGHSATPWRLGYRHIDTATEYGNEERGRPGPWPIAAVDRDEVFITTKLPPGLAGRARAGPGREPQGAGHRSRGPVADPLAVPPLEADPLEDGLAVARLPGRPRGGPGPRGRREQLQRGPDRRHRPRRRANARRSTRSRGARPCTTRPCWPPTPSAASRSRATARSSSPACVIRSWPRSPPNTT